MNTILEYNDNYIEFNDIQISMDDVEDNPYNTSFNLKVKSGVFQGIGQFECDGRDLARFASQLKQLNQFEISEAVFKELGYGCTINIKMDHSGHITVSGNIFDTGMLQELKYEFEADQTVLLPFIQSLEEFTRKITFDNEKEKRRVFDAFKIFK